MRIGKQAVIRPQLKVGLSIYATIAVAFFPVAASGMTGDSQTATASPTQAERCSREPALLHFGTLTEAQAAGLIVVAPGAPSLSNQRLDAVLSGECAKWVRSMVNGLVLADGSRLLPIGTPAHTVEPEGPIDPASGPHPFPFTPPNNVTQIASKGFREGAALKYIQSVDIGGPYRIALWSDGRQSVVGRLRCVSDKDGRASCALDREILRSPHQIKEISYLPSPDSTPTGMLRLWFSLSSGEQVAATYQLSGAAS